jgi:hypothetical protein
MSIGSDFSGSGFSAHGRSELVADGAIVRISAEGPFNVEGIEAFSRRMLALCATLPEGQAIVTLAEIRRSLLAPPDAWALLETHTSRVRAGPHRILATAWIVAEDVEGRNLLVPRARRMYAEAGREFEVFIDAKAAEAWARERLARP